MTAPETALGLRELWEANKSFGGLWERRHRAEEKVEDAYRDVEAWKERNQTILVADKGNHRLRSLNLHTGEVVNPMP